jgi:hypothetical protein
MRSIEVRRMVVIAIAYSELEVLLSEDGRKPRLGRGRVDILPSGNL